jgi:sulfonate transport system permease protein
MTTAETSVAVRAVVPGRRKVGARRGSARLGRAFVPTVGVLGTVLLWELVAVTNVLSGHSVPTPTSVVRDVVMHASYYFTNARPTTVTALVGFLVGSAISIVLGVFVAIALPLERPVTRCALAVYSLPLPALLPLVSSVFAPGQESRVVLAALFCFFPVLVGVTTGLRSAPADALDVVRAAGGGRLQAIRRVRLRAALPNLLAGLRIAGPAAFLGALVAEFGGAQSGLGAALVVSQQKLETVQVWGIALVASVIGGLLYLVATLAGRMLHADVTGASHGLEQAEVRAGGIGRARLRLASGPLLSAAALLLLWEATAHFSGASRLVFKTPSDVVKYLFNNSAAGDHRSTLLSDWLTTLTHIAEIFSVGMASALVAACLFVTVPLLFRLSLPLALGSQCVPTIAFIPLLVAVCGRGSLLISVTGLLVVFFPAVIVMVTALQEAPSSSLDVVHAYGGGRAIALLRVRLPGALPGIFAAARVGLPLALFGALVAEWLVTGDGLSAAMSAATVFFDYGRLWADVAVLTATVVAGYALIDGLQTLAQRRYGR